MIVSLNMQTNIKALYGVGAVRAAAYAKLGVSTVGDLLLHYPKRYENRGDIKLLSDTLPEDKSAVLLTVATEPKVAQLKGRLSLLKFRAFDESGVCEITYFNQNFLKNVFVVGSEFRFYGKVERKGKKGYAMASPVYEAYREDPPLPPLTPIYPLGDSLTQKQVSKDISTVFQSFNTSTVKDPLPENIRIANSLCTLPYAIRNIHMPDNYVSLAAAKKRLIFDEFFTFALGLSMTKVKGKTSLAHPCPDGDVAPLLSMLPYELTGAQARAIADIRKDMSREEAMSRIIIGDVGSGKTVCAAAAIYIAVKNGGQAALMVPTEILAIQHYNDLAPLFERLGIRCELLTSSVTKARKKKIYDALSAPAGEGRINVVIGTQALLSEGVEFSELALVVTDEQHRFGVNQRSQLFEKNKRCHMLVMSATPIPRTMALTIYGDLDLSLIDEMPKGRQRVDTFAVDEGYRERLNAFIEKQVAEGGQVYVVCPAVEETEEVGGEVDLGDIGDDGVIRERPKLKSAVQFSEYMRERFSGLRVEYMHGRMKSAEKEDVMRRFVAGEVDILVSTTVIEVGVNVPNACLMIVENAERFGLSQLHQLRGRVGRGMRKSYCVLVSDATEGNAKDRLTTMCKTYDGDNIAERDLEMRGPGDFLAGGAGEDIRQSGGVRFKLAQLCDDTGLLSAAFGAARALIAKDPELSEYSEILDTVKKMFTLDATVMN
ncbi:MAG: ATP-dependent DNA helicase RecG [Clostridia bacterium]|nr:ATP-dependent DNA helicase RecG [Clostridia bacterium]